MIRRAWHPRYRSATLSHEHTIHWIVLPDGSTFDTRANRWIEELPMHKKLKRIQDTKDPLAFRQLMLASHGRPTLHNVIRSDRGRPSID